MLNENKPPKDCRLSGGCIGPRNCKHCGFDEKENARRMEIPLTLCDDGLRRKIIPKYEEGEANGT